MSYSLPINPIRDVRRAIARFGLSAEQEVSGVFTRIDAC